MLDIRRPKGRLFCWLVAALVVWPVRPWGTVWASSQARISNDRIEENAPAGMQENGMGSSLTGSAKWAVDAREYGIDCTGRVATDGALSRAAAAGSDVIVPQSCILRLATSKTYAVALEFRQGGQLKPDRAITITLTGSIKAGRQQIFSGDGTIDFTGNVGITEVYPEWWGASPAASAVVNTPAFQAAENGAFGHDRVNGSGLNQWNKQLSLCGTYKIDGEIQFYHVIGFDIHGCAKLSSGIIQTSRNKRIVDGQNIAYGRIDNLSFSTTASQTGPLVDLDNDHTQGKDLSPQNISFEDVTFSGNGEADVGVLVAKHGGDAQGDNIRCERCYFSGFTGAGWQIGGDNTGRNVGRFYAQNAIKEELKGGDIQRCPLYGVAVYGGSIEVDGTTMENDSGGFGTQTGYDVYCEAPQDRCVIRGVRSESHKLAAGNPIVVEHSRTLFQARSWFLGSGGLAGTKASANQVFSGTPQGGDGKYYKVMRPGTFGGLGVTTATSGGSTTMVKASANWTVNAFVGQQATIVAGTGNGEYCLVTSNTATTITCKAGWVSSAYQFTTVNPDATSQFVVEPYWAGQPTTSGTVAFVVMNFNVISGAPNDGIANDLDLYDVQAMGGQINAGTRSHLDDVVVSRTDWLGSNGKQLFVLENNFVPATYHNIQISGNNNFNRAITGPVPWKFYRNAGGDTFYSGVSFDERGTTPICWSYGQNGGGQSANDVCIGIRTDNGSVNSPGRAVLGIMGTVGPVTPFGTNQPGVDLPVSGGLSTGSGKPGGISFRLGASGSAGNNVNDSNEVARIDVNGYKLPAFTFAKLPQAPNGYVVFCVDCNTTCTSGGGKGRTCFREAGAWTH